MGVLHGQPNGAKLAMSIAFALPIFVRGSGPFCMASQRELSLPRALCLRLVDSPVSAPEACVRSAVLAQYLLVIQSHARRGGAQRHNTGHASSPHAPCGIRCTQYGLRSGVTPAMELFSVCMSLISRDAGICVEPPS